MALTSSLSGRTRTIIAELYDNRCRDFNNFIDAIPESDIRLRLKEVGPKTMSEAENLAETLRVADKQRVKPVRNIDQSLSQNDENIVDSRISKLEQTVYKLSSNTRQNGNDRNKNPGIGTGSHQNFRSQRGYNSYEGKPHSHRHQNRVRSENYQTSGSRAGIRQ